MKISFKVISRDFRKKCQRSILLSSLTKPMIMIISLSFKILGDLRISADLSGSIWHFLLSVKRKIWRLRCSCKTIVGDTLVDDSLVYEKGGLDEISEDWEVTDDGLQRINFFLHLDNDQFVYFIFQGNIFYWVYYFQLWLQYSFKSITSIRIVVRCRVVIFFINKFFTFSLLLLWIDIFDILGNTWKHLAEWN